MREFGNSEVPRVPAPQPRNPWGCPTAEWRGRQMVGLLATLERCGQEGAGKAHRCSGRASAQLNRGEAGS